MAATAHIGWTKTSIKSKNSGKSVTTAKIRMLIVKTSKK
jgi:hypothetical protein